MIRYRLKCEKRHEFEGWFASSTAFDRQAKRGQVTCPRCGTHKVEKVRNWLARHPRYHVHFTPTSGSWLNLVERLFAEVTERCVLRGSHTVSVLEKAMLDYLDRRNKNPKPFVWTADADLILGKVERLCKRISRSGQ